MILDVSIAREYLARNLVAAVWLVVRTSSPTSSVWLPHTPLTPHTSQQLTSDPTTDSTQILNSEGKTRELCLWAMAFFNLVTPDYLYRCLPYIVSQCYIHYTCNMYTALTVHNHQDRSNSGIIANGNITYLITEWGRVVFSKVVICN